MLTRVFLYPRCATSVLATSSACSADGTTADSVSNAATDPATASSADSTDSITACTADASSSALLVVEGISDWRLIRVLPFPYLKC